MSRSIYTKLKQQKISRKKKELKDRATVNLATILLSGESISCISCAFKEHGEYWYDEDGKYSVIVPEQHHLRELKNHHCNNKHRLKKNQRAAAIPYEAICGFYEYDPKKKKQ